MCKAFLICHHCGHCSAPRVEKCPKKIRFGRCKGANRIEVKSPTLCVLCTAGVSDSQQRHSARATTGKTPVLESHSTTNKKTKKTYDWMEASKKPSQKSRSIELQAQTSLKHTATITPQEVASPRTGIQPLTKGDDKKATKVEPRARNAMKKRGIQDALVESSGRSAMKRSKLSPTSKATLHQPSSPRSRWNLGVEGETKAAKTPPSPALTGTLSPPVSKPQKKAPPKRLDLLDSNTVSRSRATTKYHPAMSPNSAVTAQSKTITCLLRLDAALTSKLYSLGYSPTLLQSTLLSPAGLAQIAQLRSVESHTQGLRRSPRLAPQARAEVFVKNLSRQIAFPSPKGKESTQESPSQHELDEFERAMMETPIPEIVKGGRATSQAMRRCSTHGLFESEGSEEEWLILYVVPY